MDVQREITEFSASQAVVLLQGASREYYGFTPFPIEAAPAAAGVYAFAGPADENLRNTLYWDILYIGAGRCMRDEKDWLSHARKLGATHVLVHFCRRGDEARQYASEDLVSSCDPALNRMENRAVAA